MNIENKVALAQRAFENGMRLSSYAGNQICHTVDFRKIVSVLRKRGMPIEDKIETRPNGVRYKIYFMAKQS